MDRSDKIKKDIKTVPRRLAPIFDNFYTFTCLGTGDICAITFFNSGVFDFFWKYILDLGFSNTYKYCGTSTFLFHNISKKEKTAGQGLKSLVMLLIHFYRY